jgi:choline dehydrogenase
MNPQSRGSLTLQSKDPLEKPLIDPGFLTQPYDMHCLMAAARAERKLMKTQIMKLHHKCPINVPKSESDGDTLVRINRS